MIYEPHKYGVTAAGRKVCVGFGSFYDSYVPLLRRQFLQVSERFRIELRAVDLPRRANAVCSRKGQLASTRTDFRYHIAGLPVQQRCQAFGFFLKRVLRMAKRSRP